MSTHSEKYILVAAISGAFGVKGEVKIRTFTSEPVAALSYGPFLSKTGEIILQPLSHRAVKNALAVRCEGVTTPEQADAMRGTELYIPRSALPETDEDDFYYSDLVGLTVKTTDGKTAGTIVAMYEFGANDMMEIKPPKAAESQATWYHPFTKEAVPKVDIAKGRVIIAMPEVINAKDPNPSLTAQDEEE